MRLKSSIWVAAYIRRCNGEGSYAVVRRRGAEEAGALILRLSRLDGTMLVLNQVRMGSGKLAWARPLGDWGPDARAAEWCDKQVRFDPDLWIVEIEDREGRAFVDEEIV